MIAQSQYAPLPGRALIALGGPEWRSFLQGLITQDVETLKPGELRFGALLSPQGRLLYDLFVVGRDDGAWLDVEAAHREALIGRLKLYRLRAKVEITADDTSVAALWQGPGLAGWLTDPRAPGLGWRGYGLAPPKAALADEAAYRAHCLALGVPGPADWAGETTYPIEANFDLLNGIDFHKGCYVGQETTSRMKRRGQIKSRMLPLTFEGPPPAAGSEILAGTLRAGEVLSGTPGRAMALVRLDRIEGASLTVGDRPVVAERPGWMAG
ncbi:folate-binding protein YgfZ [Caulobacter ginsengisoli]|uniref:Folate-binding protein YgfZ n=1 Tax=Caulobacter ginsengisoli TaxID=400775 RepID=A0ABU0IY56_9CAUL|nr:folate-binding protein YgfZ [Caulobacter ginsengisoli]MDQ0465989.1 folate-binding protein YgfZ [Caulobacter ginsengisoli]